MNFMQICKKSDRIQKRDFTNALAPRLFKNSKKTKKMLKTLAKTTIDKLK